MEITKKPALLASICLLAGLAVGLLIGWEVWPVQWEGAGPQHLAKADQDFYLRLVSELYFRTGDRTYVDQAFAGWDGAQASCTLAKELQQTDGTAAFKLDALSQAATGQGCGLGSVPEGTPSAGSTPVAAPTTAADGQTTEKSGGSSFILILLLLVVVGAIAYVLYRRRAAANAEDVPQKPRYTEVPESGPMNTTEGGEEVKAIPIARFRTTYTLGHDTYDDSFSIENQGGDFLGECGVSIAESIGTDLPKNVTAFEVWLFDKNDIRTVTKVVMSDHAFFDEAIRAKLAPKGEPILARERETIVLETASLIINAEITELQYGTGVLPPQSFMERFSVELSAWAKEGEFAPPDLSSRADEMMNF